MTAGDIVAAAVLLAASGWVIHRSLWLRRGRCPGCETGCAPGPSLVALGRPRADAEGARRGRGSR